MTRFHLGRWSRRAGSLAICLILWQIASSIRLNLGIVTFQNVPLPADVMSAALDFLRSPKFLADVSSSLERVLAGYGIAAVIGIGLGLIIGRSRWLGDFLQAPLELLRPIPAVDLDSACCSDVFVVGTLDDFHHLHGRIVSHLAQHCPWR